MQEVGTGNNLF